MIDRRRYSGKLENILRWTKVKTQHTKIYGIQPNLWNKGKVVAVNTYNRKEKLLQFNNLIFYLKKLEK